MTVYRGVSGSKFIISPRGIPESTLICSKVHILVHAGVGSKFPDDKRKEEIIGIVKDAAMNGFRKLIGDMQKSDACVDAVESAVNTMELSGKVNAGIGSVIQADGCRRMDASIMRGRDLSFGAVLSLRGFERPISVARLIMEKGGKHNILAHDFAADFAVKHGFRVNEELLRCEPEDGNSEDKKIPPNSSEESDTVGAVSVDFHGNLCAGTSTGGLSKASPGRIGDVPIIGAGTYCGNFSAVSVTGIGENSVKMSVAKRVFDMISFMKLHPQVAVDKVLNEYVMNFGNNNPLLGIIALDRRGRYGVGFLGKVMGYAAVFVGETSVYLGWGVYPHEIDWEKVGIVSGGQITLLK